MSGDMNTWIAELFRDPDLVRTLRSRLDALAAQMERVSDPTMNTKLQQALDALEEEIRSAM